MTHVPSKKQSSPDPVSSDHEIMLRMDLATEILEGLDELGLSTRDEVEALLTELERQLGDAS